MGKRTKKVAKAKAPKCDPKPIRIAVTLLGVWDHGNARMTEIFDWHAKNGRPVLCVAELAPRRGR